jgi:predicted transposase/invertase (TIGR01784 family)
MTNLEQTELPIFIPFTSDYGFKVTFGNEENTLFLRRAIPALIKSPRPITSIIFDKTVYPGLTKSGRSGIFDLACTDDVGNNYLVEMEVRAKIDFVQRMKFYTFQRFNVLIAKGQKRYDNLPKIYAISLLGQKINNLKHYRNVLTLKNQNGIRVDQQMALITIELGKFKVKEKDVKTDLEKLIFTIKNAEDMVKLPKNQRPLFVQEPWLDSALQELDTRGFSPEKYEAYARYMMQQAEDEREKEDAAEENRQQGKTEVIIGMLQEAMPIPLIAKIAKVDVGFVEDIKSNLKL